jgi:hypothetical protein
VGWIESKKLKKVIHESKKVHESPKSPWMSINVHKIPLKVHKSPEESYRVLKSPEESYRVLKSPEESWRVLKSPEESWRVLKSPEESWRVLKSPEESLTGKMGSTWSFQVDIIGINLMPRWLSLISTFRSGPEEPWRVLKSQETSTKVHKSPYMSLQSPKYYKIGLFDGDTTHCMFCLCTTLQLLMILFSQEY